MHRLGELDGGQFVRYFLGQHHSTGLGLELCGDPLFGGNFLFIGQYQNAVFTATVAAVTAIAAYALPLKLNIVLAIVVAVIMSMSLERFQNTMQGRPHDVV